MTSIEKKIPTYETDKRKLYLKNYYKIYNQENKELISHNKKNYYSRNRDIILARENAKYVPKK